MGTVLLGCLVSLLSPVVAEPQQNESVAVIDVKSEVCARGNGGILVPACIVAGGGDSIILIDFKPAEAGFTATIKLQRFDVAGSIVLYTTVEPIAGIQKRAEPSGPGLASAATALPGGDIMLLAKLDGKDQSILRIKPDGKVVFRIGPQHRSLIGSPRYFRIMPARDGGALVVGKDMAHGVVMRVNSDGSTEWTRNLDFDEWNIIWDGLRLSDDIYLISGRSWQQKGFHEWVAKIDANGKVIARAEVPLVGLYGAGSRVARIGDRIALIYPTVQKDDKPVIRVRMYNENLEQISDHVVFDDLFPHYGFSVSSFDQGIAVTALDRNLKSLLCVLNKEGSPIARTAYDGDPFYGDRLSSVGGKLVALSCNRLDPSTTQSQTRVRLLTFALRTSTQPTP